METFRLHDIDQGLCMEPELTCFSSEPPDSSQPVKQDSNKPTTTIPDKFGAYVPVHDGATKTGSNLSIKEEADTETYIHQSTKQEEGAETYSTQSIKQEFLDDTDVCSCSFGNHENDQGMDQTIHKQLNSDQIPIKEEPQDEFHDTKITNSYLDSRTGELPKNRSPKIDDGYQHDQKPEVDLSESLVDLPGASNTCQTGSATLFTFDLHGNPVQEPVPSPFLDDSTCGVQNNGSPKIDAQNLKSEEGGSESTEMPAASSTSQPDSTTFTSQDTEIGSDGHLIHQPDRLTDRFGILRRISEETKHRLSGTDHYTGSLSGIDHYTNNGGMQSTTKPIPFGSAGQEDAKRNPTVVQHNYFNEFTATQQQEPTHSDVKPHVCPDCLKCFPQLEILESHMLTHLGERSHICTVCEKDFDLSSKLQQHMIQHTGAKPYKCAECGKCFPYKSNLTSHMMSHTGKEPLVCNVCGKNFCYANNLKQHMLMHSGEKPHGCEICGKQFAHKHSLKNHMNQHSTVKPHECTLCGKGFNRLDTLKNHLIIHSAVKPHKCTECGKGFKRSDILSNHMKTHKSMNTGEKPFSCEVCGKNFSLVDYLKRHMYTHSGKKAQACEECGMTFLYRSALNKHMKVHREKKSHKCEVCGVKFSQSSCLKKHMIIHSAAETYDCEVCGFKYQRKNCLTNHMKIHAREKLHKLQTENSNTT